ncbi:polyprenyl synthetase family protein [Lentzea sp. NBRC 105346]|uniref:polyprenyl synthetase family protein n=1 Tax=Lentzea sp. NBRC 105346 TaxID=3032205 RepID=UPI002554CDC3|nr:polyprenyl synthetase family protein [Lentzea sp. NBRC 105346]
MPTLTERFDEALRDFLGARVTDILDVSPVLEPVARELVDFMIAGGKRMRPAFCYWGWRGAGGAPDAPGIIVASAALELLHGCALIHDDIMDASDTRRGRPSMHRVFEALHREHGMRGDAAHFGRAVAILLGDYCLMWCARMFDSAGLPGGAAKALLDQMHTELMSGQYLDLVEQAMGTTTVARARRVILFKTAKYTVENPMRIGALLAGGSPALLRTYSRFALPIGEAFQLRDDILGVFGEPAETGKPSGDDLREGKRTVLVTLAREKAPAEVDALLGDPDGVERLQSLIVETGALAEVEELIAAHTVAALTALETAHIPGDVREALTGLALAATRRRA